MNVTSAILIISAPRSRRCVPGCAARSARQLAGGAPAPCRDADGFASGRTSREDEHRDADEEREHADAEQRERSPTAMSPASVP